MTPWFYLFLCVLHAKALNTGMPGRVFSGSGIWPKYGVGFRWTQKILTGSDWIWLLPGKRYSPKFGHRMRDIFCSSVGKSYVLTANAKQPGELWVVPPLLSYPLMWNWCKTSYIVPHHTHVMITTKWSKCSKCRGRSKWTSCGKSSSCSVVSVVAVVSTHPSIYPFSLFVSAAFSSPPPPLRNKNINWNG